MHLIHYRGFLPLKGNVLKLDADPELNEDDLFTEDGKRVTALTRRIVLKERFYAEQFETFEIHNGDPRVKELVLSFLNISSINHMRSFIIQYGFPINSIGPFSDGDDEFIPIQYVEISEIYEAVKTLRGWVNYNSENDSERKSIKEILNHSIQSSNKTTWLELYENDKILEPRVYVRNLLLFSIFNILSTKQAGIAYKVCENCQIAFQPRRKAKKTTKYCSDRCRVQGNRKLKSK